MIEDLKQGIDEVTVPPMPSIFCPTTGTGCLGLPAIFLSGFLGEALTSLLCRRVLLGPVEEKARSFISFTKYFATVQVPSLLGNPVTRPAHRRKAASLDASHAPAPAGYAALQVMEGVSLQAVS